jgi:hypothetical protein
VDSRFDRKRKEFIGIDAPAAMPHSGVEVEMIDIGDAACAIASWRDAHAR